MRVVVIGGYGNFGARVRRALARPRWRSSPRAAIRLRGEAPSRIFRTWR